MMGLCRTSGVVERDRTHSFYLIRYYDFLERFPSAEGGYSRCDNSHALACFGITPSLAA